MGQWKLWSTVLTDLRKVFSEIASGFNITSACASLRSSERSIGDEVTPGDSGLTFVSHERVLHLDGVKHLMISKFSSKDDPNYCRLLDRIRAGWTHISNDKDQIAKIWLWIGVSGVGGGQLSSSDSITWNTADYETAVSRRYEGTGQWLHSDKVFQSWASQSIANKTDTRTLWVTGPGGVGKSVLCSYAVETISRRETKSATPYVFLRYGKERNKCQIAQILASQLLEHVIREQGGVEVEVLSLLSQSSSNVRNLHEMIRLLVSQCYSVYFFLDGLNEIALAEAEPSEMRKMELKRFSENLEETIGFLEGLTKDDKLHVRLWCSSQKTHSVIAMMQNLRAAELEMDQALVARDVQAYLADVQSEIVQRLSDDDDRKFFTHALIAQAGSNFRWAYMMAETLRGCHLPKLLVDKVKQGLPGDLRTTYQERFKELQMLDRHDVQDGFPPLSYHILSVLAFARRPLKLAELQEALSILEVRWVNKERGDCQSLQPDTMIQQGGIIHRCKPFVEFVPLGPGINTDGYLTLAHASVFEFLRESHKQQEGLTREASQQRYQDEGPSPLADGELITDACFKYLSQTRYSLPLRKLSSVDFETSTSPRSNIRQHSFLQYAAKYWYRHLEGSKLGMGRCAEVEAFLRSPQFITAIQIQSLFVVGHFIHSLDQNKDNSPRPAGYARLMKSNLPEWFRKCDKRRRLVAEYESFFLEWSNFLQLGVTNYLNGEPWRSTNASGVR